MKIGPKYKICRRLGDRVFSKCQTTKFTISGSAVGKNRPIGKRRGGLSEYGYKLLEKQKVKYTYGVKEKQFVNYVKEVRKKKKSMPTENLYQLLESRLDNVVYRLGFVNSRIFARQIVSHGHILVNGRKITIPSYRVKPGDQVSIRPQSQDKKIFVWFNDNKKDYEAPDWLILNSEKMTGTVKSQPSFSAGSATLNLSSILEFYSRI